MTRNSVLKEHVCIYTFTLYIYIYIYIVHKYIYIYLNKNICTYAFLYIIVYPRPRTIGFPSRASKDSGWYKVRPCQVRCLLPHEVLHSIATHPCSSVFNSIILGNQSESTRIQFWEHVRQLEPWKTHPCLAGKYELEKLVGLCIHGDGCQMHKEDENFVWSFSSIFAQEGMIGDVLVFKFPFMVIPEKFMRSSTVSWLSDLGMFSLSQL